MFTEKKINIAIDGPAAAGKSTVAKQVADQLSYTYIDTGAMYRAITQQALAHQVSFDDEAGLAKLLDKIVIHFKYDHNHGGQRVYINEEDVTEAIRSDKVTKHVSLVSSHGLVREEMVKRQREMIEKAGVVMDGRDIGTHVIPDAEVKIFMNASVDERAERRFKENKRKGLNPDLQSLKDDIRSRDKQDQERIVSPLVKAEDAIELDTTALSIEEVTEAILTIIKGKVK